MTLQDWLDWPSGKAEDLAATPAKPYREHETRLDWHSALMSSDSRTIRQRDRHTGATVLLQLARTWLRSSAMV